MPASIFLSSSLNSAAAGLSTGAAAARALSAAVPTTEAAADTDVARNRVRLVKCSAVPDINLLLQRQRLWDRPRDRWIHPGLPALSKPDPYEPGHWCCPVSCR